MKVRDKLKEISDKLKEAGIDECILKSRMLLGYKLGVAQDKLSMHLEDEIECDFDEDMQKLIEGVPIQYITNYQSFYGLDFYVNYDVLIPQPDTEILVSEVINIIGARELKVLDMCTGSGAIAISIAKNTKSQVVASDISEKALEIASKNAVCNNVYVKFVQSDLFKNVCDKYDIIVSNPPYIETDILKGLSKEVQNEPRIALDGGKDGLEFYRDIVEMSRSFLSSGGILAVEIGYNQKEEVMKLFKRNGFCDIYSKKDFGNNDRIVVGKWRK